MRHTQIIMGMPITVEIVGAPSTAVSDKVFSYFEKIDQRFSTYKSDSEISEYNRGGIKTAKLSAGMLEVFEIAARTKAQSHGYFDMRQANGIVDPSGIVKGWAIRNAAQMIAEAGFDNYYVAAGGDIQAAGLNAEGQPWRVGIRSPFNLDEIIKVVFLSGQGIATSGNYARGDHIYNPHETKTSEHFVSLTVIGPDVLEADRFATAAFAMGEGGIYFIENYPGLEGYMVNAAGIATMTTGFGDYVTS